MQVPDIAENPSKGVLPKRGNDKPIRRLAVSDPVSKRHDKACGFNLSKNEGVYSPSDRCNMNLDYFKPNSASNLFVHLKDLLSDGGLRI